MLIHYKLQATMNELAFRFIIIDEWSSRMVVFHNICIHVFEFILNELTWHWTSGGHYGATCCEANNGICQDYTICVF